MVTGTIVDGQTGEPLAGANVLQEGTTNGVSADEEGVFSLKLSDEETTKIR
ncbi:carboxypeptidase-like regulatory domain-containing protein, partial [Fodinibius sp.]|uniref:carboxypeptidase-like regulatory domain-containing protein n=1 Tax=Fodinibius sp. TaxID=1872440 RepID=UPI0035684789